MTTRGKTAAQLDAIGRLHARLHELDIDYWLFGGWAVDFHAGRVTREHDDVDVAVWQTDLARLTAVLQADGWVHAPQLTEDGYTGFEKAGIRLELAFLDRDRTGVMFTPLTRGRSDWPSGSFEDAQARVEGVLARVVSLASLIEDKSGPRHDPVASAKDRADVATLGQLPADE